MWPYSHFLVKIGHVLVIPIGTDFDPYPHSDEWFFLERGVLVGEVDSKSPFFDSPRTAYWYALPPHIGNNASRRFFPLPHISGISLLFLGWVCSTFSDYSYLSLQKLAGPPFFLFCAFSLSLSLVLLPSSLFLPPLIFPSDRIRSLQSCVTPRCLKSTS